MPHYTASEVLNLSIYVSVRSKPIKKLIAIIEKANRIDNSHIEFSCNTIGKNSKGFPFYMTD